MNSQISDFQTRIKKFIEEELLDGNQNIGPDDELLMDGYVDSVGAMKLVAFLEETFEVNIPPVDFTIDNFGSIALLAKYINEHATK